MLVRDEYFPLTDVPTHHMEFSLWAYVVQPDDNKIYRTNKSNASEHRPNETK